MIKLIIAAITLGATAAAIKKLAPKKQKVKLKAKK